MELKFGGKSTEKASAVKAAFLRAYADILEAAFDNLSEKEFRDVIINTNEIVNKTVILYLAIERDVFREKAIKIIRAISDNYEKV